MLDLQELVAAHILEMPPYEPILPLEVLSEQLGFTEAEIVKLDANENPYGTLPEVTQALATLPYPHVYPDPEARHLREALSTYHNVPIENFLASAGADELIDLIMRLCLEPGDSVINCPPTFGMYAFDGNLNRAHVVSVPRNADFSLNIAAIQEQVNLRKPKLLFLANPNNPDGSLTTKAQIQQLLDLPVMVVLDEAYIEFAPKGSSMIQEVTQRNNLIVLRTFSKWAGLAGLRVGYGIFPAALMPHLWKIKQPYNVSVPAATAASVSIDNAEKLEERKTKIIIERQYLFQALSLIDWLEPYPSQTNFILCKVSGKSAAQVKADLAQDGILIRYFNKPGLSDHIRISVGKPEQIDKLLAALERME